jgi:hypothetical protein
VSGDGGHYSVTVSGAVSGSCQVPCTLQLAPGLVTLRVEGDVSLTQNLTIPNAPSMLRIKRGSPGVRTFGITLFVLGSLGGIYLVATDKDAKDLSKEEAKTRFEIAVVDLALVLVGSVMAYSADRAGAELTSGTASREAPRPRLRLAGAGVVPTHGGALFGASLAF